ncbi:MAG: hypothetical protein ACJZ78_07115 [Prochlorococcus marinus]
MNFKNQNTLEFRVKKYDDISKKLKSINHENLLNLLKNGTKLGEGYGTTFILDIDSTNVFAKQIPLTEFENRPENRQSTVNLFNLPDFYQYGVGSSGFSAWRELITQSKVNDWVINGECENFPLMYESRILPIIKKKKLSTFEIEKYIEYWGGSYAISDKIIATQKTNTSITLFIEYIPDTLDKWIEKQFQYGSEAAVKAIEIIEGSLDSTIQFMKKKGMLHFDTYLNNLLTDGQRLYFCDFGLTISSEYNLSKEELNFFNKHQNHDLSTALWSLLSKVLNMHYTSETKSIKIEEKEILEFVERNLPVYIKMQKFFKDLRADKSKSVKYPSDFLEEFFSKRKSIKGKIYK